MANKIAYVNDVKITGNFTLEDEFAEQAELIQQINSTLESKGIV